VLKSGKTLGEVTARSTVQLEVQPRYSRMTDSVKLWAFSECSCGFLSARDRRAQVRSVLEHE